MILSFLSEHLTRTNKFYAILSSITLPTDSTKRGLPWLVSGRRAIRRTPTSNSHGFRQSPGSYVRNCYLFWSGWTQSPVSHPICKLPILLLTSNLRQGSPAVFRSGFPTTTLCQLCQLPCPNRSMLLDLTNLIIFYAKYKLRCPSLCDFFKSPVISPLYSKPAFQTSSQVPPIYSSPWGERIGSCHQKIEKYLSGGHRKRRAVFVPKMGYKDGNMFKGLEVVSQATDTFRYPHMKKSDPEPVFPRQRWCYFCTYREVPEGPGGSDVILHLAKNVSERRGDLILAWTSLQTGLSLLLSVESGMSEHWPCVSFVSHDEFSFAGCWKAEDSWPYLPGAAVLESQWQFNWSKKFLDFYCALNLIALLTKAWH